MDFPQGALTIARGQHGGTPLARLKIPSYEMAQSLLGGLYS